MQFSIQLSAYYPDKAYGGDRVFNDMLQQAILADKLNYGAVSLTEHHLINILMMAVLVPEAIYHCTKRGFHIQTTQCFAEEVMPHFNDTIEPLKQSAS